MIREIETLDGYLSSSDTPLRGVIARINAQPHLFQVIIDDERRVLGTITDGDIRRALLNGVTLDDPAVRSMHREPLTGTPDDATGNAEKLRKLGYHAFLPIIDGAGRLVSILLAAAPPPTAHTAVVMAGGKGRRLGALTANTPKPLLEVKGRPILDHVLARLEQAGIAEIYVSVNYLAEQVRRFVERRSNPVPLTLIEEERPLGTAGALAHLPKTPRGPILVVNGDVVTQVDLVNLQSFHQLHGYDATVAVARHEIEIPFGVIHFDAKGTLSHIEEKPVVSHFVAAGIYCLSPVFCGLVKPGEPLDMPELLNLGKRAGLTIGLFPIHEYWIDVGREGDLERADHHT